MDNVQKLNYCTHLIILNTDFAMMHAPYAVSVEKSPFWETNGILTAEVIPHS
jgi:hypothetical protein